MYVILPVSGQSTRFPSMRPKWMLTHPNGNLMLAESFKGLDLSQVDGILIICLAQHEQQYGVRHMLEKQFRKLNLLDKLHIAIIERSDSQPHTVYQGIQQAQITGSIFIKDSDNFFSFVPMPGNRVCYSTLGDLNQGRPANKSYILMNETSLVLNIVEKRIISDTFCCGGYGFVEASEFCDTFQKIKSAPNLYISHIIYQMILDGKRFVGSRASGFEDWGTLDDWNAYRDRFCTLFVDLDGVLVNSSAEYFAPFWGETGAIPENVTIINSLYESGQGEIIITTTRSQEYEAITREQLEKIGLKYHRILFGLQHARRIVINDFSETNPYPSCEAVNLSRNSNQLFGMLSSLVKLPNITDK